MNRSAISVIIVVGILIFMSTIVGLTTTMPVSMAQREFFTGTWRSDTQTAGKVGDTLIFTMHVWHNSVGSDGVPQQELAKGQNVGFVITARSGVTIGTISAQTDQNGDAKTSWTFSSPGDFTVSAYVPTGSVGDPLHVVIAPAPTPTTTVNPTPTETPATPTVVVPTTFPMQTPATSSTTTSTATSTPTANQTTLSLEQRTSGSASSSMDAFWLLLVIAGIIILAIIGFILYSRRSEFEGKDKEDVDDGYQRFDRRR